MRCQICGMVADELPCEGKGNTPYVGELDGVEQVFLKPCDGVLVKQFRDRVGAQIFNAPTLKKSGLYMEGQDLSQENIWLTAYSEDFLPHLKFLLWHKGASFFFRRVTDSILLDAWLSKEKETESATIDYRSLRDAVEDPDLVIIELGAVSYENRALPGVILEALNIRLHEGRPVWVIDSMTQSIQNPTHFCHSSQLVYLLQESFRHVTIKPRQRISPAPPPLVLGDDFMEEGILQQPCQKKATTPQKKGTGLLSRYNSYKK